jgi:hypothetical protein
VIDESLKQTGAFNAGGSPALASGTERCYDRVGHGGLREKRVAKTYAIIRGEGGGLLIFAARDSLCFTIAVGLRQRIVTAL